MRIIFYLFFLLISIETYGQSQWQALGGLPALPRTQTWFDGKLFFGTETGLYLYDTGTQSWSEVVQFQERFILTFREIDGKLRIEARKNAIGHDGKVSFETRDYDPVSDSFGPATVEEKPLPVSDPWYADRTELLAEDDELELYRYSRIAGGRLETLYTIDRQTQDTICTDTMRFGTMNWEYLSGDRGALFVRRFDTADQSLEQGFYRADHCFIQPDTLPPGTNPASREYLFEADERLIYFNPNASGSGDTLFYRYNDQSWLPVLLPPGNYASVADSPARAEQTLYLASDRKILQLSVVNPANVVVLFDIPTDDHIRGLYIHEQKIVVVGLRRTYVSYNGGLQFLEMPSAPYYRPIGFSIEVGDKLLAETGGEKFLFGTQGPEVLPGVLQQLNPVLGHSRYPLFQDENAQLMVRYDVLTGTVTPLPDLPPWGLRYDGDRLIQITGNNSFRRSEDFGDTWSDYTTTLPLTNVRFGGDTLVRYESLAQDSVRIDVSFDNGSTYESNTLVQNYAPGITQIYRIDARPDGQILQHGLYTTYSDDFGRTQSDPGDALAVSHVWAGNAQYYAQYVFSRDNLVLAHRQGTLQRSTDFGFGFSPFGNPFRTIYTGIANNLSLQTTATNAEQYRYVAGYLYATSRHFGVYRISFETLDGNGLESPRATLSGHLFADDNENCHLENSEDGLEGLLVTNGRDSVYTDEDGYFRLRVYPGEQSFYVPDAPLGYELICGSEIRSASLVAGGERSFDFPYAVDGFMPFPPDETTLQGQVFPNPATYTVELRLPNGQLPERATIYDMLGNVWWKGNDAWVSVVELPVGAYLVRMEQSGQVFDAHFVRSR